VLRRWLGGLILTKSTSLMVSLCMVVRWGFLGVASAQAVGDRRVWGRSVPAPHTGVWVWIGRYRGDLACTSRKLPLSFV
jgi:hypothetical protein